MSAPEVTALAPRPKRADARRNYEKLLGAARAAFAEQTGRHHAVEHTVARGVGDVEVAVGPAEPAGEATAQTPAEPAAESAAPEPDAEADEEAAQESPAAAARSKSHKKGRSSVPSWDEIMFGGGKGE